MTLMTIVLIITFLLLFYLLYHHIKLIESSTFFIDLLSSTTYTLLEKEGRVEVPMCEGSYNSFSNLVKRYKFIESGDKIIIQKRGV